jgi:hypothetical protein
MSKQNDAIEFLEKLLPDINADAIKEIVTEMRNAHQSSKIIFNVGQDGNVEPEIILRGSAIEKFLQKLK